MLLTTSLTAAKKRPMRNWSKTWITSLCLGMAFLFFVQTIACFADDTVGFGCCASAAQNDDVANTSQDQTQSHTSHCCHTHGHTAMLTADLRLVPRSNLSLMAFRLDDSPPDGPVLEIDHPPQLS